MQKRVAPASWRAPRGLEHLGRLHHALGVEERWPRSRNRLSRGSPDAGIPTDAYTRSGWNIFCRLRDRALITERDIIVDDLGKRYLVTAGSLNLSATNCAVQNSWRPLTR